ncbi:MAG: pyruvate formate-lyase-activating protein [Candidatus Fimenecus sp.]
MVGRIHSFQSLGTVDGPGVRSVVFLQGCPLRCPYCHNPDTWDKTGGMQVDAETLFRKIQKYKAYYGAAGGVTVSGGEPLLQAEFVTELFKLCKGDGLSTALDTSGIRLDGAVESLLAVTDIVLLDIKFSDTEKYEKYIGIPLETVLRFLEYADSRKKRVIVRQVVTPGVNDTPRDMEALAEMLKSYSCVEKVELLPFMKLCTEKYTALGIPFPFDKYEAADAKKVENLQAQFFGRRFTND